MAHLLAAVLYITYAIAQIVYAAVLSRITSEGTALTTSQLASSILQPIITATLAFLCPCGLFFIVRNFIIQYNKRDLLQCLCILDGCCSCLAAVGVCAGIAGLIALVGYQVYLQDQSVCNCTPTYSNRQCQDFNYSECQDAVTLIKKALPIAFAFNVISIIVLVLQVCVCCTGAFQANEGLSKLQKDNLVFCGAPPTIVVGGTAMVVGQPIGYAQNPAERPAPGNAWTA